MLSWSTQQIALMLWTLQFNRIKNSPSHFHINIQKNFLIEVECKQIVDATGTNGHARSNTLAAHYQNWSEKFQPGPITQICHIVLSTCIDVWTKTKFFRKFEPIGSEGFRFLEVLISECLLYSSSTDEISFMTFLRQTTNMLNLNGLSFFG